MHPTQDNSQPSLEPVSDNPNATPGSPASSHHATIIHPNPAASSNPESNNTRTKASPSGGNTGGGVLAHQNSGVMSISGRDATVGGSVTSSTSVSGRFSLATGDRKLAFGQLRQAVSSQLCDLLDDASINATRIVSGRRFVRWDTLPAFLAKLNLYISNLPYDFFFAKTGTDWPPAPRVPPPGGGRGSSEWKNEPGSRENKSPLGNPAIDEEMQDASSDPSRSGGHSPLSAKVDVRAAPSSTKLKYDPKTIIAQLHAQPLNINILSWKKQTIEELLAALNRGDIRVASRPQGRDVVFEILTPDHQVIDIPKWPDIYPLRQQSPPSFHHQHQHQQQHGQYSSASFDYSRSSYGMDSQPSSQPQPQTTSRSQINNQINYQQTPGSSSELSPLRSQSQSLGEENERATSRQQLGMSKFRSRPHSQAPSYSHSRTGSYSDSQGEGQGYTGGQGLTIDQHPPFSKIQFPALTPSEMAMAANPYAPYTASREGNHSGTHSRDALGSGVIRTIRPERERRRRMSAAAALERSMTSGSQLQRHENKLHQHSSTPANSGEPRDSSSPDSTSSGGGGYFSHQDQNDAALDASETVIGIEPETHSKPVKRECMDDHDKSYHASQHPMAAYPPIAPAENQQSNFYHAGSQSSFDPHVGRSSQPSLHSHPPPLKPAAPSGGIIAPSGAFGPAAMNTNTTFFSAPTPTKKWTRRSSPDRIFMNLTLNSLLRSAGMPIPRQKDDASRLPWSSIPQFLAEKKLYLTAWPEANLPWLYSGDSNSNLGGPNSGRGAPPPVRGRGGTLGVGEWRDRIDWKSSPSQRSYKPLAQALRNGEIRILPRPPGREVIFEVKDAQGRYYDSTLGLTDEWKMKYMHGDGTGENLQDASTSSGGNIEGGDDVAMNDSDQEMEDDEGNSKPRGRPGYDSRSRLHARTLASDIEQPSPTDTVETTETMETQWTSKTYPQYPSSPASPGFFSSQPIIGSLPGISSLTRPSSFGGHPPHSLSSSPQAYPAFSPPYTSSKTLFNPRSSQFSSGYFRPEPLYASGSPFRHHGTSEFKVPPRYASASPVPHRQYAESTARFQRPFPAESAARGERSVSRSPSPHSSSRQRTTSLGTSGAPSIRPHSAAAVAAANPWSLPQLGHSSTEGEGSIHNQLPPINIALRHQERGDSGSYKNVHLPPLISATKTFSSPPSQSVPVGVHSTAGASRSSNISSSNSLPTHVPEPSSAFAQPVWSTHDRTWRLPVTDEERSALPPLGDTIIWDSERRVWLLVSSSPSSQGQGDRSAMAYWSVEQRAWVLDS